MKIGEKIQTPHGVATIIRIEDVYGMFEKRIGVVFSNGEKSQYSSSSISKKSLGAKLEV